MNTIFLVLLIMAVCFILRVPIGISMTSAGIIYLLIEGGNIGQLANIAMSNLFTNVVIVAVPLFIFTANIMNSGKVTEYMFTFCKALIGKKRGATAYINILISLIFSGMSGTAMADVAGMGSIEVNQMKDDGYDLPFSAALTAASSGVGPIFPPSIPMIVFGMLAEVSVGKLFLGGVIPAFLICASLAVYVWYISRKRNYPMGEAFTFREFLKYTLRALPALITPVILLGGIYSGFVTATEAGALAAAYTIVVVVFVYKAFSFKDFIKVIRDSAIQAGTIFALVTGSYILSYVVTLSGMGKELAALVLGISSNKYILLLVINLIMLFLGMFFDAGLIMYVFVPLMLPLIKSIGVDLVQFGVIAVVNMMIGGCTPPYGILCFIASSVSGESLDKIFKEILPMDAILIAVLFLITFIPGIVMFLPNAMI